MIGSYLSPQKHFGVTILWFAVALLLLLGAGRVAAAFLINAGNVELNRVRTSAGSYSDSQKLVDLFRLAGSFSPDNWHSDDGLGRHYLQRGDGNAAVAQLEASVRKQGGGEDPNSVSLLRLGEAYYMAGQTDRAVNVWRGANLARYFERMGAVAASRGDISAALKAFRLATQIAPRDIENWYALGRFSLGAEDQAEARTAFERMAGLSANDSTSSNIAQGWLCWIDQQWECALTRFSTVVTDHSADAQDRESAQLNVLKILLFHRPDPQAALPIALARAQRLPNDVWANLMVGFAYRGLKRWEDATEWFKRAEQKAPRDVYPVQVLVDTYLQRGMLDEALGSAQAAVARNTGQANLLLLLAKVYEDRQDYEHVSGTLARAVEIAPANNEYRLQYASALVRIGNRSEARHQLQSILESDPTNETVGQLLRQLSN